MDSTDPNSLWHPKSADLEGVELSDADLSGAELVALDLTETDLNAPNKPGGG